jgi:hypothetical protein
MEDVTPCHETAAEERSMGNREEYGDVHAPVEDTEVPFGLKLLVVLMFFILGGIVVVMGELIRQMMGRMLISF